MDQVKFVEGFKNFGGVYSALADHITSSFLKADFHKFYLVHSWILWLKYASGDIRLRWKAPPTSYSDPVIKPNCTRYIKTTTRRYILKVWLQTNKYVPKQLNKYLVLHLTFSVALLVLPTLSFHKPTINQSFFCELTSNLHDIQFQLKINFPFYENWFHQQDQTKSPKQHSILPPNTLPKN